jgi:hypothetical protein
MCDYSGIDDPQRYTKEELSSKEIERRIRNIIKVGRDEKLELKIPMYENGNCPEVSAFLFRHGYLTPFDLLVFLLQLPSLPPSKLNQPFRYPRANELSDDEDEIPSPKRQKSSPIAEEEGPSHGEPMAEKPAATERRFVGVAGGCIRGLGKRIISRRPSPALRGHLETAPEHSATIRLPKQK